MKEAEISGRMKGLGLERIGLKEVQLDETKEITGKNVLEPNIETIKGKSLESIVESNKDKLEQVDTAVQKEIDSLEIRTLTEAEKQEVKEKIGMTDANLEKCMIDKEGTLKLKCKNDELAGKQHPETGVPFIRKTVDLYDMKLEGVFPTFSSITETKLPDELRRATSEEQFRYLGGWLREEIKLNPELRSQFNEMQIAMIEKGRTPKGYTWHHNEEVGKMQLVDFEVHQKTGHTGGNSTWSDGN